MGKPGANVKKIPSATTRLIFILLPVSSFPAISLVIIRGIDRFEFCVVGMRFIIQLQDHSFILFNDEIPGQSTAVSPLSPFDPIVSANARIIINLSGRVVMIRFMFATPSVGGRPRRRATAV
jgi:hypothetical protein